MAEGHLLGKLRFPRGTRGKRSFPYCQPQYPLRGYCGWQLGPYGPLGARGLPLRGRGTFGPKGPSDPTSRRDDSPKGRGPKGPTARRAEDRRSYSPKGRGPKGPTFRRKGSLRLLTSRREGARRALGPRRGLAPLGPGPPARGGFAPNSFFSLLTHHISALCLQIIHPQSEMGPNLKNNRQTPKRLSKLLSHITKRIRPIMHQKHTNNQQKAPKMP